MRHGDAKDRAGKIERGDLGGADDGRKAGDKGSERKKTAHKQVIRRAT
jgi:hypothetical protein